MAILLHMEILIISGFLGAGKTTFIQSLAKATKRQYVIVENEFSDIGIDGDLLKNQPESPALEIKEISEGCICCSTNIDFASTVLTIANAIDPDYLIVEPSGVAFLQRILQNLQKIVYERIRILDPIAIVDGQHYLQSMHNYPAYFFDQVASAKHIVISKSEKFSQNDFLHLKENLPLDAHARFIPQHYSKWNDATWKSLFSKEGKSVFAPQTKIDISDELQLENIGFSPFNCKSPDQLIFLFDKLNSGKYGNIVRAKGVCKSKAFWFRFDFVQGSYQIGECKPMKDTRAVVIGSNLNKQTITALFSF